MGASKALAERVIEAHGTASGTRFARRPLRQRARQLGLGAPHLPAADRARRAGHGHPRRDDALLHDHPRGRAAGDPGHRHRRGRRHLRAQHGRAGEDHRSRPADDRALGPRARRGHRHRRRGHPSRREAPRGALQRGRGGPADPLRQDHARHPPCASTPTVLRDGLDEIGRRVADGRPEPVAEALWTVLRGGRVPGDRRRRPGWHLPPSRHGERHERHHPHREPGRPLPVGARPVAPMGPAVARLRAPAPTTAASAPASPATTRPAASCSGARPGSTTSAAGSAPPAPSPGARARRAGRPGGRSPA